MDNRGNRDIHQRKRDHLAEERAASVNERGQHCNVKDASLRIEQIGDKTSHKVARAVVRHCGFTGRCLLLSPPTLRREPEKVNHPSPSQCLIEPSRAGDQCRQSDSGGQTHYHQSESDTHGRGNAMSSPNAGAQHGQICHIRSGSELDEKAGGRKYQQSFGCENCNLPMFGSVGFNNAAGKPMTEANAASQVQGTLRRNSMNAIAVQGQSSARGLSWAGGRSTQIQKANHREILTESRIRVRTPPTARRRIPIHRLRIPRPVQMCHPRPDLPCSRSKILPIRVHPKNGTTLSRSCSCRRIESPVFLRIFSLLATTAQFRSDTRQDF